MCVLELTDVLFNVWHEILFSSLENNDNNFNNLTVLLILYCVCALIHINYYVLFSNRLMQNYKLFHLIF